ncbi:MAG TPA: LptF/LptG family permease [Pseudomonadales bacterium]|nr:LptF/LptG family permease [Pseudomonadales bacterium]
MNRAYRYLARELAKSYALIGIAMVVLFDLLAFLNESQDIGEQQYTTLDALIVVAYSTPALFVDLSPFVGMLATLNAYERLNATSELIALRGAGVSGGRLAAVASLVAMLFMCFVAGVEYVARPLRLDAALLRIHETAAAGNLLRGSGFWIRSGQTFVNVSELAESEKPAEIRIVTFAPDAHLESYTRATSAEVVDATHWRLDNVWSKQYADDGTPAAPDAAPTRPWQPPWDPSIRLYDLPVASFTIRDLMSRIAHRANESVGAQTEAIELWRRLTLPLAGIAYALLAAPFALLTNVRGGRALRLAIGAVLALLVYVGQQLLSNAGILAGLPVPATAIVPTLLVFVLAFIAIRRLA